MKDSERYEAAKDISRFGGVYEWEPRNEYFFQENETVAWRLY